jgi:hypothetical protein
VGLRWRADTRRADTRRADTRRADTRRVDSGHLDSGRADVGRHADMSRHRTVRRRVGSFPVTAVVLLVVALGVGILLGGRSFTSSGSDSGADFAARSTETTGPSAGDPAHPAPGPSGSSGSTGWAFATGGTTSPTTSVTPLRLGASRPVPGSPRRPVTPSPAPRAPRALGAAGPDDPGHASGGTLPTGSPMVVDLPPVPLPSCLVDC